MRINTNTTIGSIIKQNPQALDAIVSLSPKFEKLRNPVLRKLMAGRTTIGMASKMGDCTPGDFFAKLLPLGFEAEQAAAEPETKQQLPAFLTGIKPGQVISFDVTSILATGKDPLKDIMAQVKALQAGYVLKIISPFQPAPLVALLEKQGFESYVDVVRPDFVETYFSKKSDNKAEATLPVQHSDSNDWNALIKKYDGKIQEIDVRHLEMPQPMLNILAALDTLPANTALYVHHKRVPVFLLPELNDRGFEYRVKEISDSEVYLLIFKA